MIPRVNLKDPESVVQRRFTDALKQTGFCILSNTNIPYELHKQAYDDMKHFFSLSLTQKVHYEKPHIGRQRGYASYGIEQAITANVPDPKEFYSIGNMHSQSYGCNIFPNFTFEQNARRLMDQNQRLSHRLLGYVSDDLKGHQHAFGWAWRNGEHLLRYIHYPESNQEILSAEHEDINLLTILPYSPQPGLQIQDNQGTWHDAPLMYKGEVIVDSGDMLKLYSKGIYQSTTHRVIRKTSGERYSMPFFVHPEPTFLLDENVTAKTFLEERLRNIGVL
jgi:isopenicillin N synthase-like dioxygenase